MKRLIRRTPEEKMGIINLVEHSPFSVRTTMERIQIPSSTFYHWYKLYQENRIEGLVDKQPHARQFWNRRSDEVQQQVVDLALEYTEESPRLLAWCFVDGSGYFISESSVYRLLQQVTFLLLYTLNTIVSIDRCKVSRNTLVELTR